MTFLEVSWLFTCLCVGTTIGILVGGWQTRRASERRWRAMTRERPDRCRICNCDPEYCTCRPTGPTGFCGKHGGVRLEPAPEPGNPHAMKCPQCRGK